MLRTLIIFLATVVIYSCSSKEITSVQLNSPDGKITVTLSCFPDSLYYAIEMDGTSIIKKSLLGFEFNNQAPLADSLRIISVTERSANEQWTQVWGETKQVTDNHNQVTIELEEMRASGRKLNLIFKVFNDGTAFRYHIPEQTNIDSIFIINEKTQFHLAQDYSTWFIPAHYDSYELLYQNKLASKVESANTPVTFESNNRKTFLSIHEANLTNYAGMTLKKHPDSDLLFHAELVPWPDGTKVKAKAPMATPWRTIQLGRSAGDLSESTMILNLNEPNKLADVSWIEPMKYIGIWWGMHLGTHTWTVGDRHGATTENVKKYIDFAAENNIQSVLAEGWNTGWEHWGRPRAFDFITPYEDFDLPGLAEYAKAKGVELIGHHETGGDAEYYEEQMDKAFSLYQSLGIRQLKTGYAGGIVPRGQFHHGQFMVSHYRKVVEKAAEYQISINAHEPIKATGIRRTYPNMMTREGARGMEWNAWSAGNPPEHHTILPFTRNLGGPLDYTPGIFDLLYGNAGERVLWNNQDDAVSRVNTTLAKQLALFVVFYSPQQMASDLIKNYENQPAFQFIKDVPVDWEFSKVLNGKIGDYITIVRKDINSNNWYLGAISDEEGRSLRIGLGFLEQDRKYIAEIYQDSPDTHWETNPYLHTITKKSITNNDSLNLILAPGGGQAIRFRADN